MQARSIRRAALPASSARGGPLSTGPWITAPSSTTSAGVRISAKTRAPACSSTRSLAWMTSLDGAGDREAPDADRRLRRRRPLRPRARRPSDRALECAVDAEDVVERERALEPRAAVEEAVQRAAALLRAHALRPPRSRSKSPMSSSSEKNAMRTSPPRFFLRISTSSRGPARGGARRRACPRPPRGIFLFFALPFGCAATRASMARTERPRRTISFASSSWSAADDSASSARAWPAESAPSSSASRTAAGSLRRRSAFATVARSLPTRSATSSCVRQKSSLQVAVGLGFLEGREVAALHVLDEREEKVVAVRDALAHDDGNLGEAREPGRAHAALARDDPVALALPRDEDGLEDPRPPDGPRELREAVVVEAAARLAAVRVEEIERDGAQGRGLGASARAEGMSAERPRPSAGFRDAITAAILAAGRRTRPAGGRPAAGARGRSRDTPRRPSTARRRGGSACRRTAPRRGARSAGRRFRRRPSPKCFRISSRTCRERFVRSSHIVATTPASAEARVEALSHAFDRREELGDALEREVLALDRHEDPVRRDERVHASEATSDGGQSIEDVFESVPQRVEPLGQAALAALFAHELHLGAHEVAVRGHERQVGQVRRPRDLLERRPAAAASRTRCGRAWLCRRRARTSRCPAGRGPRGAPSRSRTASDAARLIAVVVLPTPPFWFATARTRAGAEMFHVKHSRERMPRRSAPGARWNADRAAPLARTASATSGSLVQRSARAPGDSRGRAARTSLPAEATARVVSTS